MDYELTIIPRSGYLHAIVTGRNSAETVSGYLSDLLDEVKLRGCPYVLVEERLEGPRLGLSDVFAIVSDGTDRAFGTIRAMAFVDLNATDDTMEFAELAATNRAMPVRVFTSVADAERWLVSELRESPTQ